MNKLFILFIILILGSFGCKRPKNPLVHHTTFTAPQPPVDLDSYLLKNIKVEAKDSATSELISKTIIDIEIGTNGNIIKDSIVSTNDSAVAKEAIRLIRNIKNKWTPGTKDGANVIQTYSQVIEIKYPKLDTLKMNKN